MALSDKEIADLKKSGLSDREIREMFNEWD